MLDTAYYILYSIYYIVDTMHYIVYIVCYILYTIYYHLSKLNFAGRLTDHISSFSSSKVNHQAPVGKVQKTALSVFL